MANRVPQFIADEGKRLKSNNDPYWTRLTANMENVLLGYPPADLTEFKNRDGDDVTLINPQAAIQAGQQTPEQTEMAQTIMAAAAAAVKIAVTTRERAQDVTGRIMGLSRGIDEIMRLIEGLPRGGRANRMLYIQTIGYLQELLTRLQTNLPVDPSGRGSRVQGQGPTEEEAYKELLGKIEGAVKDLQARGAGEKEGGQGGQGGTKVVTGGRRKRRRKRGGFMYSPAARKASVARLKSRKASVRTHRRKRHKRTVRRRYKKSRRRQRRKRRRRGGRTRRRRR